MSVCSSSELTRGVGRFYWQRLDPMPDAQYSHDDAAMPGLEANIRMLFDTSVATVQLHSSKIQQAYLIPTYKHAKTFSKVYPILSLYIASYLVLGFFPIVLFLSASVLVLSTSLFVAVCLSLILSVFAISIFGILLFCALFLASILSIASTLLALGAYLLFRLVTLIREQPTWKSAISRWATEVQEFILSRLPDQHQGLHAHLPATEDVGGRGHVVIEDVVEDMDVKKEAEEEGATI